jgi:hypothetical protein
MAVMRKSDLAAVYCVLATLMSGRIAATKQWSGHEGMGKAGRVSLRSPAEWTTALVGSGVIAGTHSGFAAAALAAVGSTETQADAESGLETVALIYGSPQALSPVIHRELAMRGIRCYVSGSLVYGLQVEKQDAKRAIQVLSTAKSFRNQGLKLRNKNGDWDWLK